MIQLSVGITVVQGSTIE